MKSLGVKLLRIKKPFIQGESCCSNLIGKTSKCKFQCNAEFGRKEMNKMK